MRIAYCISGFARVYRDTIPLLEKNVLKILAAKHQVDVFISTWEKTDRGGYAEWHKDPILEFDRYFSKPNKIIDIEKNFEYKNRYINDFYKRWRAFNLVENQEGDSFKYDAVFRDRFDTVHFRPFPLIELEKSCKDDFVFVPRYKNDHEKTPIQDWCAFGSRTAMANYFGVYSILDDVPEEQNLRKLSFTEAKINDPEWVLYAALRFLNQKWEWSSYEVTPYDRYFGNKVHEKYIHVSENGEEFALKTREYDK
jgi:hypothetical protein